LHNLTSGKVTVVEEVEAQCNISQTDRNYFITSSSLLSLSIVNTDDVLQSIFNIPLTLEETTINGNSVKKKTKN